MNDYKVLLVCGSGASSGFLAVNMRKAAKKLGYDLDIVARGSAEIEGYIDEIDVVMVGPHMAYIFDDVNEIIAGTKVKAILMKPDYYATLNGEKAVEHLLDIVKG